MTDRPFLTTNELAERWEVDISWIAHLCRNGRLEEAFKVNPKALTSAWLIPMTTVVAFEEEKEAKKKSNE